MARKGSKENPVTSEELQKAAEAADKAELTMGVPDETADADFEIDCLLRGETFLSFVR